MKDNIMGMWKGFVLHERDEGQFDLKEAGFCPS
ncbi:hypothetical protein QFZ87_000231 [Bacillus sp. SLBN-46]|nr:hypothetical protein [Bacillus sp. SLBN-46]